MEHNTMHCQKKLRQPNLVFIYTDEQAVSTMPCYGNRQIETPNLNSLADKSFVFDQCYCSQPVCTPSRSSILTGLYPHATGCTENNMLLPDNIKCLPELADFSGYKTGHFGKWHLGDEVFAQHGFEKWISIDDGYRKYYRPERDSSAHCSYYHWLRRSGIKPDVDDNGFFSFSRGFTAGLPEEYSKPAYLAEESVRFIRNNKDNPFILYINFFEPHMPFSGPRDNQYNPDDISLPNNFNVLSDQPFKASLYRYWYEKMGAISDQPLKSEKVWKRLIANYWGLVSLVDTHIGKILDAIEASGIDKQTIIVFTSDHGDMMGSHKLVGKCVQFQEAVRVPFMIHVPWLKPKGIKKPVSQVDIVPTLLELMGKTATESLHGKSLCDELSGRNISENNNVLIQWNGSNSPVTPDVPNQIIIHDIIKNAFPSEKAVSAITDPVRTIINSGGWKLNCSRLGENQLYNIREDPGETKNLIKDPSLKNVMKRLYENLLACQKRIGDNVKEENFQ